MKFAADGSVIYQREWAVIGRSPFPEDDQTPGGGVAAAPAGGAYVAGSTSGAGFNPNLIAAQFDALGNAVWHRVGGPGFGSAEDVAVGPNGNVHVTGSVLVAGGASGSNAFVWTLLANGKGHDAALWGGDNCSSSRARGACRSRPHRVAQSSLRALPARPPTRSVVDRRTRRPRARSSP